jgi:hypothetical protein
MDVEARRRRADRPATAVAREAENEAKINVARIVSDAVAGSSVLELLQ